MDIVHLMEASTEPLQERISQSYAEIEQTIALDHSEGQTICVCGCVLYVWLIQAAGPDLPFFKGWSVDSGDHIFFSLYRYPHTAHSLFHLCSNQFGLLSQKCHKLGGLSKRNFFLTVLERGSQRSG